MAGKPTFSAELARGELLLLAKLAKATGLTKTDVVRLALKNLSRSLGVVP